MSLSLLNAETAIGSIGRLWASAPVTIGSLTLTGMEVPRRYPRWGRRRNWPCIRLPGGNKHSSTP
ncbi:hypothetical protein ACOZ4Y_02440 [Komagataeibacter rhaeticus]